MKRNKFEVFEVETLDDICEVIHSNTNYLLKQNKKLNRKVNTLTFIIGAILFRSISKLSEEIDELKLKYDEEE